MTKWKASNETSFTDDDLEQWVRIQESDESFAGEHLGPSRLGSPVSIGDEAFPDSYLF